MTEKKGILNLLNTMLKVGADVPRKPVSGMTNAGGQALPDFAEASPQDVKMIEVKQDEGRLLNAPYGNNSNATICLGRSIRKSR